MHKNTNKITIILLGLLITPIWATENNLEGVAEKFFSSINLNPNIHLSSFLTKSGAKVEIRGKNWDKIKILHQENNWLELINLITGEEYKNYPSEKIIKDAAKKLRDYRVYLLCLTDLRPGKIYEQVIASDFYKSLRDYDKWELEDWAKHQALHLYIFPSITDINDVYRGNVHEIFSQRSANSFRLHPDNIGYTTHFSLSNEGEFVLHWKSNKSPVKGLEKLDNLNEQNENIEELLSNANKSFIKLRNNYNSRRNLGDQPKNIIEENYLGELNKLQSTLLSDLKKLLK